MSSNSGLEYEMEKLLLGACNDDEEDILVIGIDFGTTFSGVAWATRVDFENHCISFITSWPGIGGEEGKVPTELWYDDDNEPVWGYEVPPDVEPFRWFKLLLLRDGDMEPRLRKSEFVVRVRDMMEESARTAKSLIADYLRLLWAHIIETIEKARGEAVVETLAFHVVITVPAIWKDYARQTMKEATVEAGILGPRDAGDTRLTFVPEPEAAALSTLVEQGSGVQPGNVYIICDAGGGTVDLISYEVKSIKPIMLQEVAEGTGGLCGGIFIDQAFERMCAGRLGSKWRRLSNTGIREIMKKEWENGIKPQFKLTRGGKEYIVSLPAEAFRDSTGGAASLDDTRREPHIKNGRIYFQAHNIKKAFEGVFSEIEELVRMQIVKAAAKGLTVTGIILVGGLGCSPYLFECLKNAHSEAGIAVLQSGGIKPRTAICRGAVFRGFLKDSENQTRSCHINAPIMVTSTVSRASYGIIHWSTFDAQKHEERDRIWSSQYDEYLADNQMMWYLNRGETVSMSKPVRLPWSVLYEPWEFDKTFRLDLYQNEDVKPPTRKTSNVQQLGTLCCDLDVNFSDLPLYHGKNKEAKTVRILRFEVELVPTGASAEFVLYIGGRMQGSKNIEVQICVT